MHHHEKKAFLKFFITYFISVAMLILVAGFFYFSQSRNHFLKAEEFSLIEYARHIKMGDGISDFSKEYKHKYLKNENQHIDIRNFTATEYEFSKLIPMNRHRGYLQVIKSKKSFDENLWNLKQKVIASQILLLILFAYLSYILAKNALKPLQESILTLDKFAKDLIHDLNTPVTSIKLNMRLLEKIPELQDNKSLIRLTKSVHTISELHENLTTLLQEETFQTQFLNICDIVNEITEVQKQIYPDMKFISECSNFRAKVNKNAMKQILQNIISNACKYNAKDGYVKIYTQNNMLHVQDNGHGIKEPDKIFDRSYSGENSSGIGLDIVKRLADAMGIDIKVKVNKPKGSIFILRIS